MSSAALAPTHHRTLARMMIVAFLILIAGGTVAYVAVERGSSPGLAARSSSVQAIDQFAVNLAARAGDSTPASVQWVETTRGPANSVVMGATIDSADASTPVYALQITGNFTLKFASVPEGASLPTGSVLQAIVDPTTFHVYDYGVVKTAADMSSLGSPETDPLSGITPTSPSAWRAKYHIPLYHRPA
jgi:hypothetical protein